jgi:hypothetical protein
MYKETWVKVRFVLRPQKNSIPENTKTLTLKRKHWNGPIEGSKQEYQEKSPQDESSECEQKRNGADERLNRIEKKLFCGLIIIFCVSSISAPGSTVVSNRNKNKFWLWIVKCCQNTRVYRNSWRAWFDFIISNLNLGTAVHVERKLRQVFNDAGRCPLGTVVFSLQGVAPILKGEGVRCRKRRRHGNASPTGQASAGKSHGRFALAVRSTTGIRKTSRRWSDTLTLGSSIDAHWTTQARSPPHIATEEMWDRVA